jgi:transcriptional regulator with XRE-family HTH domain
LIVNDEHPPLAPVTKPSLAPLPDQAGRPKQPNRSRMKEALHHVDVHVGGRVRLRRMLLGMSQGQLGEALGLTFQQVQKYEHGTTRMSAAILHRAAEALDIPISFFFDGLDQDSLPRSWASNISGFVSPETLVGLRPALMRDVAEFVELYVTLPIEVRQGLLDIVRATSRNLSPAASQPN